MRLRRPEQFERVRAGRVSVHAGPLRIGGVPNDVGHHRLGLAISRRAGHAVRRNRIKRMLREAFRLSWRDLPGSYDLVVSARPHDSADLASYQQWLAEAVSRIDRRWQSPNRA